MPSESDWQPVEIYGYGLQKHLAKVWRCDPAWDVHAICRGADAELPHPDRRRVERDPTGQYPNKDKKQFVFWNRHIDRRFHIVYPRTRRESPRPVSRTLGDNARDWQAIVDHRDRYLGDAGLSTASPAAVVAKCLADTFKADSYFKNKPSCKTFESEARALTNPVEGLLHQCFCVGCAHAYAALAEASELTSRTIGCGAHRVAEVLIDGRWHFVENSCRHESCRGLEAYFPTNFMEVTLNPEAFAEFVPEKNRDGYWGMPSGQFHFTGGTWQSPMTLRFSTSNAFALYPEVSRWGIKSLDGKRLPIVQRRNGFYWEDSVHSSDAPAMQERRREVCPFPFSGTGPISDFLYHPFRPGDALRQSFWLDATDDVESLEVIFPFAPEPHVDFSDSLGRGLVVTLGDFRSSLVDAGAWPPPAPDNRGHRCVTVRVPREALRANAVNWIELHNRSDVTMQAPFLPTAMEPYIPPLRKMD